jgi:molecular chaperone DnaK
MWSQNQPLGNFELTGLPPAPRGIPKIEVTFDIDANGIVHVSAKDQGTGKEQSMTISGGSALSKDEIDRMVRDAEAHASEDRGRRELIEKRNGLDSLLYQAEKTLKENGEKVPSADKLEVENAISDARKDLDSADVAKLDAAHQRVERALHKVAEALYKAQSAAGDGAGASQGIAGAPPGGGRGDGAVGDAEYSEEKGNN